jgi:hypothetical protein
MTTKRDIQYRPVDIFDKDAYDPKNLKVRIATFFDDDVLILLKMHAKKSGPKYRTVLNALLRSFFDKPHTHTLSYSPSTSAPTFHEGTRLLSQICPALRNECAPIQPYAEKLLPKYQMLRHPHQKANSRYARSLRE